jgi:hypothetical protein
MSGFTHTQLFWDHWAKLGGCTKSGLAHLPFAANSRIPVMYAAREGVELGGLVSYGVNLPDLSRATAIYLDSVHDVRPRSPDWVNEDARVI